MNLHRTLRPAALSAAVAAFLALGGCASIVNGQNQSLSVTTRSHGVDVAGAQCSLTNDKGTWYVTTPGSVTVHRSLKDITTDCKLAGEEPGATIVPSKTKAMAFGNIVFGGVIGAGVDVATGAAYDYPEVIVVTMGQKSGSGGTTVGAPARPAANETPAPREPRVISVVQVPHFTVEARPGGESVVRAHVSYDARCAGRPAPDIGWIDQPRNGSITIKDEMVTTGPNFNGDTRCAGLQLMGRRIYYHPNEGFHGKEEIAYKADFGGFKAEYHATVEVQ